MQRGKHERPRERGQDRLRSQTGEGARVLAGDRHVEQEPEPRLADRVIAGVVLHPWAGVEVELKGGSAGVGEILARVEHEL